MAEYIEEKQSNKKRQIRGRVFRLLEIFFEQTALGSVARNRGKG